MRVTRAVAPYATTIASALVLSAVLVVAATDASPGAVLSALYDGALATGSARGLTLEKATPILIVAAGIVVAARAGIVNIGPEGQLLFGATCATAVALGYPGGGFPAVAATLVAAAAGGALWAGIAALLRFTRGVDVVITTLLLNFVAFEVVSFAVNRSWLLRETTDAVATPQSDRIPADSVLPRAGDLSGFSLSAGVLLAVVAVVVVWVALRRTGWGFNLRVLGLNPTAAAAAGVSVAALGTVALLVSGALAGLAGGVMLTGSAFRLQPGFSANVGFDGLLVALIARANVLWAVPVALFFGALRAGGGFLAATGVPRFLVDVVQALLVLAALLPPVLADVQERRRQAAQARAAALMSDGVPA